MLKIQDYANVVGQHVIDELGLLGGRLQGKVVQNVNSTAVGGGVAEILTRMIPLLKQVGVEARWDVIKGDDRFYSITKNMHNALHGVKTDFHVDDWEYFIQTGRQNIESMETWGDIVFIHDPQPIVLIERRQQTGGKWCWRCHIDVTQPQQDAFDFLRPYIERYDAAVFSAPAFSRIDLTIPQILIAPSIDPLADKNKEIPESVVDDVFRRFNIDREKPIITQISRFDRLKDPAGVIKVYKIVKRYLDCQLILAGGGATDDPEGPAILAEIQEAAASDKDIHVINLPPSSDIEINALQRGSTVVLQKSLKEGFGLTVTEALWKAKPVVASAVGGIPLQIAHEYSGLLSHSIEGTAHYLKALLNDPAYAKRLGENGREHVRNNFLITRHIRDYLMLFLAIHYSEDVVYLH